jgi:hypothetical protein
LFVTYTQHLQVKWFRVAEALHAAYPIWYQGRRWQIQSDPKHPAHKGQADPMGTNCPVLNWQAMPQFNIGSGEAPMSSAVIKYSIKPRPKVW